MRRLAEHARAAADALLDWVYPRHCYGCGEPLTGAGLTVFCRDCFADIVGGTRVIQAQLATEATQLAGVCVGLDWVLIAGAAVLALGFSLVIIHHVSQHEIA